MLGALLGLGCFGRGGRPAGAAVVGTPGHERKVEIYDIICTPGTQTPSVSMTYGTSENVNIACFGEHESLKKSSGRSRFRVVNKYKSMTGAGTGGTGM